MTEEVATVWDVPRSETDRPSGIYINKLMQLATGFECRMLCY